MTDFFVHAVVLLWSIIGTIVASILLLAFAGLLVHEIFAVASRLFVNPNNQENQ